MLLKKKENDGDSSNESCSPSSYLSVNLHLKIKTNPIKQKKGGRLFHFNFCKVYTHMYWSLASSLREIRGFLILSMGWVVVDSRKLQARKLGKKEKTIPDQLLSHNS